MARFVVFRSPLDKQWYWHLKADNGQIMAQSEGYSIRWSAKRGAKRFAKLAADAPLILK